MHRHRPGARPPAEQCQPHWDYEFLVPDYLKYADIVRSGRRVADIHDATGGRPDARRASSSTAWRRAFAPRCASCSRWARRPGASRSSTACSARFTDDEKTWLERVAASIAPRPAPGHGGRAGRRRAGRGPGVVLLDAGGRVVSATREAVEWLDELDPALLTGVGDLRCPSTRTASPRGCGRRTRTASRDPRAAAHAPGRVAAHARRRSSRAPTSRADHRAGEVRRRGAADRRGLRSHRRELDVTRAIARGLKTSEIAAHLHLSPHTVRDHVKAVFEKVGVFSRGELVHRVFAEHYAPPSH